MSLQLEEHLRIATLHATRGDDPEVVAERDRLTRSRDRLPKLKRNTRKKLAAKRAEDRLEFQKMVEARRGHSRSHSRRAL